MSQIFKMSSVFSILFPLGNGTVIHSNKLESLLSKDRKFCARFGLKWQSGSREEGFLNSVKLIHFHCFAIILSRRRTWPFIVKKLHFTLICFVLSFFEIGPIVLEKMKMQKSLQIVRLTTSDFEPSAQVSEKLLQKV